MRGDQIKTLSGLKQAVKEKRTVVMPEKWHWRNPCPAALVITLQNQLLAKLFYLGMFIYRKKKL